MGEHKSLLNTCFNISINSEQKKLISRLIIQSLTITFLYNKYRHCNNTFLNSRFTYVYPWIENIGMSTQNTFNTFTLSINIKQQTEKVKI